MESEMFSAHSSSVRSHDFVLQSTTIITLPRLPCLVISAGGSLTNLQGTYWLTTARALMRSLYGIGIYTSAHYISTDLKRLSRARELPAISFSKSTVPRQRTSYGILHSSVLNWMYGPHVTCCIFNSKDPVIFRRRFVAPLLPSSSDTCSSFSREVIASTSTWYDLSP